MKRDLIFFFNSKYLFVCLLFYLKSNNYEKFSSGTDGEEIPGLPKGIALRRNIREVMDETKLDESTLAAQRQEAERLRRVQEQQRLLRELQRQAAQERMQHKVMAMLQGNQFSKPGNILSIFEIVFCYRNFMFLNYLKESYN